MMPAPVSGEVPRNRGGGGASIETSVHFLAMKCLEDRIQHRLRPMQDIGIPEPQDAKPIGSQEVVSLDVVRRIVGVLAAVEFNDEPGFHASEVADVRTDGPLPAEAEIAEAVQSQVTPEQTLGISRILAQMTDQFIHGSD